MVEPADHETLRDRHPEHLTSQPEPAERDLPQRRRLTNTGRSDDVERLTGRPHDLAVTSTPDLWNITLNGLNEAEAIA
jgi:hypothetical protein